MMSSQSGIHSVNAGKPGRVAVRQRFSGRVPDRPRRTFLDKLTVRFPWIAKAANLAFFSIFPPGSYPRRMGWSFGARRIAAAINRGDLAYAAAFYAADVELVFPVAPPTPDRPDHYRGREAAFNAYREWMNDWERFRRVPRELIDLGDTVVLLFEETGRGRASGIEVSQRVGAVFTIRGGRTIRHEEYPDWESALAAVGLE
jgi:ketosteroid isomerase-like protein